MTAKLSKAFQQFGRTTNRSGGLLRLYKALEHVPKEDNVPNSELLRAAIVLSVSAMDAYYTDRFCELLVPYLKKNAPGETMISLLSDAGLDTRQALIMASMKRPFRRIRTLVQNHLDKRVTQRFKVIDELFLCYGIRDFSNSVVGFLRTPRIHRNVESLIERRHQIVHEGDMNDHGRLRSIDYNPTIKRINYLIEFVAGSERFISISIKL